MRSPKLHVAVAALCLIAVSCGDDKEASDTTAASADVTTTSAGDGTPVNQDPVKVELSTRTITVSQTVLAAGTINFEVTNIEEGPHVFALAKGDSYPDLPLLSNGAVDAEALGADLIAKTGLLMPGLGTVKIVTVDLAPGTYVIYCNAGDDPSKGEVSHGSEGEHITITVV